MCIVCDTYPEYTKQAIEDAGIAHHEAMAEIKAKEARGEPIDILFDSVRYHEAWNSESLDWDE